MPFLFTDPPPSWSPLPAEPYLSFFDLKLQTPPTLSVPIQNPQITPDSPVSSWPLRTDSPSLPLQNPKSPTHVLTIPQPGSLLTPTNPSPHSRCPLSWESPFFSTHSLPAPVQHPKSPNPQAPCCSRGHPFVSYLNLEVPTQKQPQNHSSRDCWRIRGSQNPLPISLALVFCPHMPPTSQHSCRRPPTPRPFLPTSSP